MGLMKEWQRWSLSEKGTEQLVEKGFQSKYEAFLGAKRRLVSGEYPDGLKINPEDESSSIHVQLVMDAAGQKFIKTEGDERVFATVQDGDQFIHDGILYTRITDVIEKRNPSIIYNAVRLYDGTVCRFEEEFVVTRVLMTVK